MLFAASFAGAACLPAHIFLLCSCPAIAALLACHRGAVVVACG
ncbi:hypothetical protein BVRB_9g217180 [Beta vulgaris subsp. vulgaris]|nr:hypothetical protein BVRB_9g217180 [Beta vulgaris subsp. vulgaris]